MALVKKTTGTIPGLSLLKKASGLGCFGCAAQEQEFGHLDLCEVFFNAFFIGVVSVDQFSFEGNLGTFVEVFFCNFGYLSKGHEVVPLRFGYFYALGIAVGFVGRHRKANQFFIAFELTGLGLLTNMSNQLNLVFKCVHNGCFFKLMNLLFQLRPAPCGNNTKVGWAEAGSRFLPVCLRKETFINVCTRIGN